MPLIENLQLGVAVCRIGIYTLWRRLCCKKPPAPRPEFEPVCIGLDDAGKTTLLSLLAGEPVSDIQPTTGFIIKAIQLKKCILHVKEIGGSEKVRKFWQHYYRGAEAVIFVLDSAGDVDLAGDTLHKAVSDPALQGLPLLILANGQDKKNAMTETELYAELELGALAEEREFQMILCSKEDIGALRVKIEDFCARFLLRTATNTDKADEREEEPAANQL